MNQQFLLKIAIEASIKAGKAIMTVYSQPVIEAVAKDDLSPLTLADQQANDIILRHLAPTGIPVLSEESLKESWEVRKSWKQCWIVDPLDGTKEFIKRNGDFTVNIALVVHGKPVMGIIFAPATGEIYFGMADSGAFKTILSSEKRFTVTAEEVISLAKRIPLLDTSSDVFKVVASRSHRNSETDAYISGIEQKYAPVRIISRGSSLKICMVADGSASVYPRFAPTMEWDTAAGHAIAAAAGCRVFNPGTNKSLTYNKERLENPYFIVRKND
ncbi:MAG: 3'(2'),5'-bisphosphate nucleotidase CysQ [Bacteroidetes bacterium]|nr:3'(2'),5'-bisphosphate nucleotidase CysQ [Bacteroidota bacterium]